MNPFDFTGGGAKEPSADIRQTTNQLRQIYVALVAEGFTEGQALAIVGQIIAAGAQAQGNNGD